MLCNRWMCITVEVYDNPKSQFMSQFQHLHTAFPDVPRSCQTFKPLSPNKKP